MRKLFLLLAVFSELVFAKPSATSSWTGRPLDSRINRFPYPYQVGREIELTARPLGRLLRSFDWSNLNDLLRSKLLDSRRIYEDGIDEQIVHDYFSSPKVFEKFKSKHPQSADELMHGIEFFAPLRILGPNGTPVLPSSAMSGQVSLHGVVHPSLMSALNSKWNRLPTERRLELIDFGDLTSSRQILAFHKTSHLGRTRGKLDFYGQDLSFDQLRNYTEFRDPEPLVDAERYLEELAELARDAGIFETLLYPLRQERMDSSYHVHFSVKDRPETLAPILEAWNDLIAVKLIDAGIMDIFQAGHGRFESIDGKGFVHLVSSDHVELRTHFTDPESELAMFMELAQGSNAQALHKVYEEWMPKLNCAQLRWIFDHAPELLGRLAENSKSRYSAAEISLVALDDLVGGIKGPVISEAPLLRLNLLDSSSRSLAKKALYKAENPRMRAEEIAFLENDLNQLLKSLGLAASALTQKYNIDAERWKQLAPCSRALIIGEVTKMYGGHYRPLYKTFLSQPSTCSSPAFLMASEEISNFKLYEYYAKAMDTDQFWKELGWIRWDDETLERLIILALRPANNARLEKVLAFLSQNDVRLRHQTWALIEFIYRQPDSRPWIEKSAPILGGVARVERLLAEEKERDSCERQLKSNR